MVDLARRAVPAAWPVQADLEALPFRRGALGGAWARASYLHLPRVRLPAALAELHRALAVDAPATLTMHRGDAEGLLADDDFPGRFFAGWQPDALADVLVGAGFRVDDLANDSADDFWLHARVTRLADAARHGGARDAAPGVRPQPERVLRRRRRRLRPDRQPVLARGARGRDRVARRAIRATRCATTGSA